MTPATPSHGHVTAKWQRYLSDMQVFAADPVGPVYDPQRMLDDFRNGVPAAQLQTRAWALAGPAMPHAMALFASAD